MNLTFFIELSKKTLPKSAQKNIRPVYYKLLNRIKQFQYPKITPLPKTFFKVPALRFRLEFFEAAQLFLQVNRIDGSYVEFGSHEANTFRMALNTLGQYGKPNKILHFWSFDSFSGMPMPEGIDKQKIWRSGMNFTSEHSFLKMVRRDIHRVSTVKGFYSVSLQYCKLPSDQPPALVYFDCDYYSSTHEALIWIGPHLRHGSLIAFDDWDCFFGDENRGQRLAFKNFREAMKERFVFTEFFKIKSGGMSYICLEKSKIGTSFGG